MSSGSRRVLSSAMCAARGRRTLSAIHKATLRPGSICPFGTTTALQGGDNKLPAEFSLGGAMDSDFPADMGALAPDAPMKTQWKGMKRFYTKVSVAPAGQTFGEAYPFLAKRSNPSTAATSKLAGEFAAQKEMVIPASTPLYNLASSAIDGYAAEDPEVADDTEAFIRASRLASMDDMVGAASPAVGGAPHIPSHAVSAVTGRHDSGAMTASSGALSSTSRLRDLLLDFLETDSACFRIDVDSADPSEKLLRKRQDKYYTPLLDWWRASYGVQLATAQGFNDLEHPDAAYTVAEDFVELADPFLKSVATSVIGTLKSTVITMAFLHRHIDIEAAFQAARVEEEWQIAENGFVEDGHDTARAQLKTALASASPLMWLSPTSQPMSLPKPGAKNYEKLLKESIAARETRVGARRAQELALVGAVRAKIAQQKAEAAAEDDLKAKLA